MLPAAPVLADSPRHVALLLFSIRDARKARARALHATADGKTCISHVAQFHNRFFLPRSLTATDTFVFVEKCFIFCSSFHHFSFVSVSAYRRGAPLKCAAAGAAAEWRETRQ
jgi:hypothetical protein